MLDLHLEAWSQRMWEALNSKKRHRREVGVCACVRACMHATDCGQYSTERGGIGCLVW